MLYLTYKDCFHNFLRVILCSSRVKSYSAQERAFIYFFDSFNECVRHTLVTLYLFCFFFLFQYFRNFAVRNITWGLVAISLRKIWPNYRHAFMRADRRNTSHTRHHTHILPCTTTCQFRPQVIEKKNHKLLNNQV